MNEHKSRFVLNPRARNALVCALSQEEYSKVHSFRSAKQKWLFEVKHNKLSLLTRKYELFSMEEGEDI